MPTDITKNSLVVASGNITEVMQLLNQCKLYIFTNFSYSSSRGKSLYSICLDKNKLIQTLNNINSKISENNNNLKNEINSMIFKINDQKILDKEKISLYELNEHQVQIIQSLITNIQTINFSLMGDKNKVSLPENFAQDVRQAKVNHSPATPATPATQTPLTFDIAFEALRKCSTFGAVTGTVLGAGIGTFFGPGYGTLTGTAMGFVAGTGIGALIAVCFAISDLIKGTNNTKQLADYLSVKKFTDQMTRCCSFGSSA